MLKERDSGRFAEEMKGRLLEGSKGGEETPHTPVETPNNLLSVAYAKVLLAVAEGELAGVPTGQDIFLNGTPLLDASGTPNFGGVTWDWRPGTQDQTYIQGMPEISNETSVGVELRNTTPWVHEITKESLSAFRITLSWAALQQQIANGDTVGVTIDYAVDLSLDGGPYQLYKQYQVTGKTNTDYERTHRIDLPKAVTGWTIRLRRITPNSESSLIQDTMTIKSYAEVVDAKQTYPNTALLFVQFDSRLFGGGSIPKISIKTKGRYIRVPTNYTPENRGYDGIWDGTFKWAWSDNPAWIFFDLVTQDRFGLGNRVTVNQVDKWELYEVAQYCDVLVDDGKGAGGKEPRHTCNIYIQSQEDAWTVLRDICSIFNGMTYWDGNQFIARADKQEPLDNIPLFGRSNIVGDFDYQTTDERTIFTSALVSYDEPADHYGTQVEAVWEKSQILRWGGDRQTTMAAIGCTSRGEAQRKGKYTLITNMFNRSVIFKTGLQGLDPKVKPGAIIGVADPLIAGKEFTGRLMAATLQVVTLDRVTEAKAGDKLYITRKDGSQEARTIQAVSGKVVTVTTNYSEIAMANSVWYLEADDLKSQLFKVTKLVLDGATVEINGIEYNDSKFAAIDNGARLEPRPISKVPPQAQKPPSVVTISSNSYIEQMQAITTMTIAWPKTENAVLYEGQWRVGQGDWVTLGTTGAQEFNVKGIYTGQYVARVRALNAVNIKSAWTLSAVTELAGKAGTPPALTEITVDPLIFGMRMKWKFPNGAEDTARTEFMYSETPSFTNAIKLGDYAYPQATNDLNGLKAGKSFFFWGRLVDRTGNIGPWYPSSTSNGIMGLSSTDVLAYEEYFVDQIKNSSLGQELADRIDLIDGNGPGSVNQRLDDLQAEIGDLADALEYDPNKSYVIDDTVRQGQRLYQAKIAVPAAADGSNTPPNATYWYDIGQIVKTADATALLTQQNKTEIDFIDGKVNVQAQQITAVQAELNGKASTTALNTLSATVTQQGNTITAQGSAITGITTRLGTAETGIAAQSQAISALDTKVTQVDGKINVQTTRLDGVYAQVNPALAGDTTGYAGTDQIYVGVWSEQSARIEDGVATGQRIDVVQANVNSNSAAIQTETTARTTVDNALANQITTVQAIANGANAAVQTVTQAQATTDGKLNTMWAVKMHVNGQGQYVTAGVGLGIENGPAGLQSKFLVSADTFAVVNGLDATTTTPFVVSGGQVFIKSAVIEDASIDNVKIGQYIQSNNYVFGTAGWAINKNGGFEMNSADSRMRLNSSALKFYHPNGVLGIDLSL